MEGPRHLVTRQAREIVPGDVIAWRGLYLPVIRVSEDEGFPFPLGVPFITLYLGNAVRGGMAIHPAALTLIPGDLVNRWELIRPPNGINER